MICLRITPACAGKSPMCGARVCVVKDHPRVCGEKCRRLGDIFHGARSPPRVRGKVMEAKAFTNPIRITPACAGKSKTMTISGSPVKDHPRVCGEKRHSFVRSHFQLGSPPRVRGKANRRRNIRRRCGITPACAGKRCFRPHGKNRQ